MLNKLLQFIRQTRKFIMPIKDLRNLFVLAAIWGSSFLFMRLAVHDFGPIAMIEMRVGISAIFLIIVSALTRRLGAFLRHWRTISIGCMISVTLPFLCYGYASQSLTAGFMAIVNA